MAKATVSVHRPDPLIEEGALRLILLVVLSFYLEDEHRSGDEADQEIWSVLTAASTIKDERDFNTQMIILHPGMHMPVGSSTYAACARSASY